MTIMFSLEYANQARKFLKKTEKRLAQRLLEAIEELRKEPVPHTQKQSKAIQRPSFVFVWEAIEFCTRFITKKIN